MLETLRLKGVISEEVVKDTAKRGYSAISSVLGDQTWLLGGTKPCSADVVLFDHLMNAMVEPIYEHVNGFPNLLTFCDQVKSKYFEAYGNKKVLTQNGENHFEGLRGFKAILANGPMPIPTGNKRLEASRLEEKLRAEAEKTVEEIEEEQAVARGNRNALLAAGGVLVAYILASVVDFSFVDMKDDYEEDD